jgi:predicted ABC-type ATPase
MIAGPNGSGKSTLVGLLRRDYAVNFYTMLNADEIFAEVSKTRAYLPALPVDRESLLR